MPAERVLVLGAKITGREVACVLASRGASVLVSDSGAIDDEDRSALEAAGVEIEEGSHDRARAKLDDIAFVVPSPGISPLRGFLAEIVASGKRVVSELDLAAELTDAPIVAVTGTNGKTTVCRLAEAMGREAGLDAYACGNLETKFITAAAERPDADVFVVEASSFALTFCETFHPQIAVITSFAPDHLDWHGTLEHYHEAKAKVSARQTSGDLFIYPTVQPELAAMARDDVEVVAFGARDAVVSGATGPLAARGTHFLADAAAAAHAMGRLGVDEDAMRRAIEGFSFDAHRLDFVGTRDSVRVYNDAVSANPQATIAALRTFDEPVVLIAGGRKKVPLDDLASEAGRLRAAVVIGEAAGELEAIFTGSGVFVSKAASMREAVAMGLELAKAGDIVLLSPACASHDMFKNYADRGRVFLEVCAELGVGNS